MMRNIGLFLGSALLAFVLVAPRTASSQTRSIGGPGCTAIENGNGRYDYSCALITDSTTYTVAALSGAWFDFACFSNHAIVYILNKFSWTGTYEFDLGVKTCNGESNESEWLAASEVLSNADQWDHVWANLLDGGYPGGSAPLFGVTACFSGGANDCL